MRDGRRLLDTLLAVALLGAAGATALVGGALLGGMAAEQARERRLAAAVSAPAPGLSRAASAAKPAVARRPAPPERGLPGTGSL